MEIKAGTPEKSGWYFNVIPTTGRISNNPSDFIILWTDCFDKEKGDWLINDGCDDFWTDLPLVVTPDGQPFAKGQTSNPQKITLNDGYPKKKGYYLIALAPGEGLPWYFPSTFKGELPPDMKGVLQSDQFGEDFGSIKPNSFYCEDEENIIGWVELPELVFPDGTLVKY